MAYPLNVGKGILRWSMPNGALGINVLCWERQDFANISNGDCATMASHLEDWYHNSNFLSSTNAPLRQWLTNDISLEEIICEDVGAGPTVQSILAVGLAGNSATTPLPNESSVVTTLYSQHPGRRGRGRTFLPGVSASSLDQDGTILDADRAGIQQTYEGLREGLATDGNYQLVVHSVADSAAYGLDSVVTRAVVHHQRRRNS